MVTAAPTWRDERRRDRLVEAEIAERRETARAQLQMDERRAKAQARAEEQLAKSQAKKRAREERAAFWAACGAWLERHVLGLLFVPVIGVPGALAWTGMAAYGAALWGPLGLILPALSEGGTWVFAAATTITRHRHPDRPLWHLRLGTAVFAALGGALNFAHGVTTQAGWHGIVDGAVYALVSVSGVTAHQLITAGPRRSKLERAQARREKAEARMEKAVARAALHAAVAFVDSDGSTRLVFTAGRFTVKRRWFGRVSLEPAAATSQGGKGSGGHGGGDRPDVDTGDGHPDGHDDGHPGTDDDRTEDDRADDDRASRDRTSAAKQAAIQAAKEALKDNPDMTDTELAKRIGRSARTVRRWREQGDVVAAANGHVPEN
jgi:hypothetical protein